MRRVYFLIAICIVVFNGCREANPNTHLNQNKPGNYEVRIKVPEEWIEKLRRFDYSRKTQSLLKEFETIIKPDTIANPHAQHVDGDYGRILNPMFVDLDGEVGEELVAFIGWDYACPSLCVFKELDGDWFLIYMEPTETFYNAPSLSIAGNFSKNKVFYYRQVDGHGSGTYIDSYYFYKLINSTVYKCLKLTNEAHDYAPEPFLSKEINMDFEFSGDESDKIYISYRYNFFTESVNPLIEGQNNVHYNWNDKTKEYQLTIQPFEMQQDNLIAEKNKFLDSTADDSLFVNAFKNDINEILKKGTPQQKKALHDYLNLLK